MSDILTAISRGCKGTLTDGSVRYTIEFEPRHAIDAAKLFAMPGTEMGVVALKDGRDHTEDALDMVNESIPEMVERLDVLARADLGIVPRALNVVFGDETTAVRANGAGLYDEPMANDQVADAGKTIAKHITLANYAGIFCADPKFWEWIGTKTNKPTCEAEAAHYIRWRCNIASRAEIDNSKIASGIFRQIMREFDAWGQK